MGLLVNWLAGIYARFDRSLGRLVGRSERGEGDRGTYGRNWLILLYKLDKRVSGDVRVLEMFSLSVCILCFFLFFFCFCFWVEGGCLASFFV